MKSILLTIKYSRVGSSEITQNGRKENQSSYSSGLNSQLLQSSSLRHSQNFNDHSVHPPSPKGTKRRDDDLIKLQPYPPKRSFQNGMNINKYLMFGAGNKQSTIEQSSNSFIPFNQPLSGKSNKSIISVTRESLKQSTQEEDGAKSHSKSRNSLGDKINSDQFTFPLVKNDSIKFVNNQAKIKINIKNKSNEDNEEVTRREIQLNYYRSDGVNKSKKMLSELSDVPGSYLKSNLLIKYTNNQDNYNKNIRRSISNVK